MVYDLWVLICNAVEIKLPSSFDYWNGLLLCPHGKHYTLINVSVHGEQIELNPIFIACFTVSLMSYDQLNKHMYFICNIVSAVCLFLFQLCSAIALRLFISKS